MKLFRPAVVLKTLRPGGICLKIQIQILYFYKRKDFVMKSSEDLRRMLRAVDHKSYPAYKDLRGAYSFGLSLIHI